MLDCIEKVCLESLRQKVSLSITEKMLLDVILYYIIYMLEPLFFFISVTCGP